MADISPNLERRIARLKPVKQAVRGLAREMAPKARKRLRAHRVTGDTKIRISHGKVDSFVSMVGVGAVAIEYGHGAYMGKQGYVGASQGLYIMSKLAAEYGAI